MRAGIAMVTQKVISCFRVKDVLFSYVLFLLKTFPSIHHAANQPRGGGSGNWRRLMTSDLWSDPGQCDAGPPSVTDMSVRV